MRVRAPNRACSLWTTDPGFDANGDGEASWGTEDSERVNPWFDGEEYSQDNNQTWRDVASANC